MKRKQIEDFYLNITKKVSKLTKYIDDEYYKLGLSDDESSTEQVPSPIPLNRRLYPSQKKTEQDVPSPGVAISSMMKPLPKKEEIDPLDMIFPIGKYKGHTMKWILENDLKYAKWVNDEAQSSNNNVNVLHFKILAKLFANVQRKI